jgi:hypothetical protein
MRELFFLIAVILISHTNLNGQKDFTPSPDSLEQWVSARIENAALGQSEKVELLIVVRSNGWGTRCPEQYIGVSTSTQEGPFIQIISPENFPVSDSIGYSLIVEGYFTGKRVQVDLRLNEEEPDEWVYLIPEFKITKWKYNKKGYERKWFNILNYKSLK